MQLRCTFCQTMFALSRDEILAALEHMSEHKQIYYDAHCPKCRRANRVERLHLERAFPDWQQKLKEMAKEVAPGGDETGFSLPQGKTPARLFTEEENPNFEIRKRSDREETDCEQKVMTIKVVFFDFGGVIGRTADNGPRQRQADRLGISLKDLVQTVFDGESHRRATLGEIGEKAHWLDVMRLLGLPEEQAQSFSEEFFSGDQLDRALIAFIRSLRPAYHTGLISNAWSGLRGYIVQEKFEDAFDAMIISAEIGLKKPDPRIYQLALEKFGIAPQEAVFVDDFIENIEAARTTGLFAVHFTRADAALKELKKLLADHK